MVSGPVFRNFNTRLICVIQTVSRVLLSFTTCQINILLLNLQGENLKIS